MRVDTYWRIIVQIRVMWICISTDFVVFCTSTRTIFVALFAAFNWGALNVQHRCILRFYFVGYDSLVMRKPEQLL